MYVNIINCKFRRQIIIIIIIIVVVVVVDVIMNLYYSFSIIKCKSLL